METNTPHTALPEPITREIEQARARYSYVLDITTLTDLRENGWRLLLKYDENPSLVEFLKSLVAPSDFESSPLTPQQLQEIERKVHRIDKLQQTVSPITSIQGTFKRGKSYTLGKLCEVDDPAFGNQIPFGEKIETFGISAMLPRRTGNIIPMPLIDSAGTDRPLDSKKKFKPN